MDEMDDMDEKILLIESDPAAARLIREALADARYGPFAIEWVATLSDGLDRLDKGGIKAVLLNLSLPDSQGIATFDKLYVTAVHVPVLILSDLDQEGIAQQAIQHGAQDYVLKDHIDGYSLSHALRNVMARKVAEEELFIERERAQVTLDSIGDAVISADIVGNVTYLNLVAERMTGWSREEAAGRPLAEVLKIIDGATREPCRSPIELAVQHNKPVGLSANCVLVRRDGVELPIEDSAAPIHARGGHVIGAVMVFHDVSAARTMVLKMSHLAQHDALTDLPNRVLLNDRLTQALSLARRRRKLLAVLFLDLDLFKNINDSLGHLVGDKLLQSVADRLLTCVRSSDTVSRQGGDEFVILLSDIEHSEDAARRAENIISVLEDYHRIAEHDLNITMSIGISVYPGDGEDAETLIKNADAAMYHAKQKGRNNYQFFKQEMNDMVVERQSIEASLRRAIARQEFVLHYQPKINLETGEITGAEALLRWLHPTRGLLAPKKFVAVAEECGLIVPIGRWVLREACRQVRAWLDAGLRPAPVAINISAVEFRSKDFIEGVRDILKETRLEPRYLEIELTESVLMQDGESTIAALQVLNAMGVQLAIDDFGTGYSSLSYLKRFPIDTLKIDQSFVHDITIDPDDATIVSAVIGMGNSLNKRVSAEGVETLEQLAFLRAERCGEGQGYYFSRPVVAEEYTKLLKGGISEPSRRRNGWITGLRA
ncbi:MAG: response regulator receiver [Gammaproteobacteria bacterium]|nr:MAG: response regulator receiver [Gammaproteobacteria bacterium]TND01954.1 MAG: response regulator receiver modulated diguanylate cyclase/phosphodiesterase with PAS/PAC sensor(s) [Gammaproteobacteria bacterium]